MNKKDILKYIKKTLHIFLAIICTVIIIFPIYWMIITSFRTSAELIAEDPSLILDEFHWENYSKILTQTKFLKYLKNTIITTFGIVFLQVSTGVLGAYGLATGNFKHKKLMFFLIIGAMMIPQQITFIPLYINFARLGFTNTFLGLILPEAVSPFLIYLLYTAFLSVDKSLIEMGKMDGLNKLKLLWHVYIPSCFSTFITTVLLSFINGWNSYFWPKIITNNESHRVLTVGISYLKTTLGGDTVSNYNEVMAGVLLSIIPVVILFIIFQRYITGENKISY